MTMPRSTSLPERENALVAPDWADDPDEGGDRGESPEQGADRIVDGEDDAHEHCCQQCEEAEDR